MLKTKPIKIIIAAVIAIILLSGTVFAVVYHLTASDVALFHEENALAEAFKGKDAKIIDQTITAGEYKITLLGMVSGNQLLNWQIEREIDSENTYIVVMASYNDGKKMDYTPSENGAFDDLHFTVAFDYAAPWMFPSEEYSPVCIEGNAYYLINAINLEPFADRHVKLFAFDKYSFPTGEVFSFDQETGKLSYNKNYTGVQASFDLPLDEGKSNAEKAKEILKEWNFDDPYIYNSK